MSRSGATFGHDSLVFLEELCGVYISAGPLKPEPRVSSWGPCGHCKHCCLVGLYVLQRALSVTFTTQMRTK